MALEADREVSERGFREPYAVPVKERERRVTVKFHQRVCRTVERQAQRIVTVRYKVLAFLHALAYPFLQGTEG